MSKKTSQSAVRFCSELLELAQRMAGARHAANFSEYVRGLVLLDAAYLYPTVLVGFEIPAWLTRDERFIRQFLAGTRGGQKTKKRIKR